MRVKNNTALKHTERPLRLMFVRKHITDLGTSVTARRGKRQNVIEHNRTSALAYAVKTLMKKQIPLSENDMCSPLR